MDLLPLPGAYPFLSAGEARHVEGEVLLREDERSAHVLALNLATHPLREELSAEALQVRVLDEVAVAQGEIALALLRHLRVGDDVLQTCEALLVDAAGFRALQKLVGKVLEHDEDFSAQGILDDGAV